MRKISKVFKLRTSIRSLIGRDLLVFILAFQMAVGLSVPSLSYATDDGSGRVPSAGTPPPSAPSDDQNPDPSQAGTEAARAIAQIEGSDLNSPVAPVNIALIANQQRWIWSKDGQTVERVIDLNQTDVSLPEETFADVNTQIELEYDVAGHRLLVHRVKPSKNGAKATKLDSHVWTGVTLTAPLFMDSDFIYLATSEGVRVISLNILKRDGFNKPVPALRATRAIPKEAGLKIKKVSLLNRGSEPRAHAEFDGGETPLTYLSKDLALDVVRLDDQGRETEATPLRVDRDDAMNMALEEYLALIVLMNTRSPQYDKPEVMDSIQAFFDTYADLVKGQRDEVSQVLNAASANDNDLLISAVSALAERSGLVHHIDSFQEIAAHKRQPRDRFSSDPSAEGPWARDFQIIQEARARLEREGKNTNASWDDLLAGHLAEKLSAQATTHLRSDETRRGRLFNGAQRLWATATTPKGLATLAATLGGVYVLGAEGVPVAEEMQIWMTTALSQMWSALTTSTASPQDLRDALTSLPKYLQSGGSGAKLFFSGLMFVPVYFVTIGMLWAYQNGQALMAQGKSFNYVPYLKSAKDLMLGFMKGFLIVNRLMEIPWILSRQKNVHSAVDHNIPLTQPGVFNLPTASAGDLQGNVDKLNEFIKDRSTLNAIATRFAAATLIAQKEGIDDVATLFQEERRLNEGLARIATTDDSDLRVEWMILSGKVHQVALEILKNKDTQINVAELEKSYDFYKSIAQKLARKKLENPSFASELKDRVLRSCKAGSRGAFEYLLGNPGRMLYAQYFNSKLSDQVVSQNFGQGAIDFTASQLIWMGAAPEVFVNTEGRLISATVEQELLWKGKNTVDVLSASIHRNHADGRVGARLHDPSRGVGPSFARTQTLAEALVAIFKGVLDPRAKEEKGFKDPLEAWAQYIKNIKNGAMVNIVISAVPLYLATFLPHIAGLGDAATTAVYAALTTTIYILLSKYGVRSVDADSPVNPGADHYILGYATVWPFVTSFGNITHAAVEQNKKRIQSAASLLLEGIEQNDMPKLQQGARDMKALYKEGRMELPKELNIDSSAYTVETGRLLLNYSANKIPLPTVPSTVFDYLLNIFVGSGFSMVLYNNIQKPLVDSGGAGFYDLAWVMGWVGVTYVSIKTASYVLKPVLKGVDKLIVKPTGAVSEKYVVPGCEQLLGRDPVNVN